MSGARLQGVFLAAFVFLLNAALNPPLFLAGETVYRGSIEAGYASIARFITAHPNPWGWNPTQYAGLPTQFTYLPLLPYLTAALHAFVPGADVSHLYRLIVGVFACLGPATLLLFVWYFTRSRWWGLAAALGYTFLSGAYNLVAQIDTDRGFVPLPWRLHVLAKYGEGPHTAGLTLLPLALLAVWNAAVGRRYQQVFLAAVALAAVTLTNWVAALALAICSGLLLLAGFGTPDFRARRALAAALLGYLLAAFWLTPRFLRTVALNWPSDAYNYRLQVQQAALFAGLLAGLALLRWLFRRRSASPYLCFLTLVFFAFAYIVLLYYWLGLDTIPESRRYALEFELFLFPLLFELVRAATAAPGRRAQLGLLAVAGLLLWTTGGSRPWRYLTIDDTKWAPFPKEATVEYRLARWIADHQPAGRVFAFGGLCFRLNSWFDLPQVGGVFESGLRNRIPVHFSYQVRLGTGRTPAEDARHAVWQLQAIGAEYLVVHGPESKEYYHDFKDPQKFDSVLEAVYRQDGDVIYRLPVTSLAHLVRPGELPAEPPVNEKVSLLGPYAAALADSARPSLQTRWRGASELHIEGSVPEGMQVAVQVTEDRGWTAAQDGTPVVIRRNTLGFMTLETRPAPSARLVLRYSGTTEQRVLAAVSLLAWIGAFAALFRKPRLVPPATPAH